MKNLKKIKLGWWNTSLSPYSKKNQSTTEHKEYVVLTLHRLLNEMDLDIVCLCEVSKQDIEYLMTFFSHNLSFFDGTLSTGRKMFDLCVLYRTDVVKFLESTVVSRIKPAGNGIYAGQKIEFEISDTKEILTLFLVHWSSRRNDYEDSPNKAELGMLLRTAIDSCLERAIDSKIIILGDFNEEPFNKSLTHHLSATRDIARVKKKPNLLYNPFWRHMVYSSMHPESDNGSIHGGTYYYKSDSVSRWKTFDQMIFSSDFILGKTWHLNESETIIFSDAEFIKRIYNVNSAFDHLPIISAIQRS